MKRRSIFDPPMLFLSLDEVARLACPVCRSDFTRLEGVTTYFRLEDAQTTEEVRIRSSLLRIERLNSQACGNPSPRRSGLAALFTCEICDAPVELQFAADKGATEISWSRTGGPIIEGRAG